MTASRRAVLPGLLAATSLALGAAAGAGPARRPPPLVVDPLPFEHDAHRETLQELGIPCQVCHAVFSTARPGQDAAPPRSICHGCHRDEAGVEVDAPSRCEACHPRREDLRPDFHGALWEREHGEAARAARFDRALCGDCHDTSQCVTCHEARGALVDSPHFPGFRGVHGVEARLDPASCATCHAGETCVRCHRKGERPW